ncbi:unnamed protein product, partial [Dicrocoelium dendriticum]
NLRALMYGLPATPRHAVRRIAGRIVPAIATTTATVAGLVCIELVKYVCAARDFRPPSSSLSLCARNAFLNLALPVILLSEPAPCAHHRLPNGMTFTLWDRWTLSCPMEVEKFSLSDLLDEIKRRYALEATVITQGNRMVYVNYLPTHRPRLKKPRVFMSPNYGSIVAWCCPWGTSVRWSPSSSLAPESVSTSG